MLTVVKCKAILTCAEKKENWNNECYIVIENGMIKDISEVCLDEDHDLVDWSDMYVIPGMINCHVHFCQLPVSNCDVVLDMPVPELTCHAINNLKQYIDSGVTTIRDCGGLHMIDLILRDLVKKGELCGPDIFCSGQMLTPTGGHGHDYGLECDGVAEFTKAARKQLKSGVNQVKIMATGGVLTRGVEPGVDLMSQEEVSAVTRVAHRVGKKVVSHAQGLKGIKKSLYGGVDSIEHGFFLDDECIDYMVKNNIFLVPTLSAPDHMANEGSTNGLEQEFVDKVHICIASHVESFKKAKSAGVRIAVGTDSGTPFNKHSDTVNELRLMCQYGMTPYEAIYAATRESANCIGASDRGTIEVGKRADIIAVSRDPLEDILALCEITHVMQAGLIKK